MLCSCTGDTVPPPEVADSTISVTVERIPLLTLSPQWTVGDDPDAGAQFYIVWEAARHHSGEFLVIDAGNDRVVVLDESGRLVRSFGRAGDGPGEFSRPTGLALRGDTVLVGDQGDRVHFFSIEGTSLSTYVLGFDDPEVNRLSFVARDSVGWLVSALGYFRDEADLPPVLRQHLYRLDPEDGAVSATGLRWSYEEEGVWSDGFWVDAPFAHRTSFGYDREGRLLVNDSPTYEIRALSPDGGVDFRIVASPDPIPITPALVDDWLEASRCTPEIPECSDRRMRLAATIENPDQIQPIDRIRTFNSGFFAVRRNDLDEDRFDGETILRYDYFSPDRQFAGSTDGLTPLWFDGAELLALERDALGVERIVLYSVG